MIIIASNCRVLHITTLTTLRSEYLAWPAAHCGKRPPQRRKQGVVRKTIDKKLLVKKINQVVYNE